MKEYLINMVLLFCCMNILFSSTVPASTEHTDVSVKVQFKAPATTFTNDMNPVTHLVNQFSI